MSYRSRTVRKAAKKSYRNLIATIVIIALILYATLSWILPTFITLVGSIRNIFRQPQKQAQVVNKTSDLAPPVIFIPYEATNSASIDISGYAVAGSKVKVYLDDDLVNTAEVKEDGSFLVKDVKLSLGTNNIYGKTIDDKGNESLASKPIRLLFDNEKPNLNISEPGDGKVIQGGDKKVRVAGKTQPGVQILINGTRVIVSSDGSFSSDVPLNDGSNSIEIKAVDTATNTTQVDRTVTYNP